MAAPRYRCRRNRFAICGARWLAAALYLVVAAGVPLPSVGLVVINGDIAKDSSQAFPCQHSRCGCASAQQCWRSCCCHSLRDRLAWAREHGVTPPDFAIAQAREQGLEIVEVIDGIVTVKKKACCAHRGSCSDNKPTPAVAKNSKPAPSGTAAPGVLVVRALACKGLAHWAAAAVVVPQAPAAGMNFDLLPGGSLVEPTSLAGRARQSPDPRPPRSLAV